MPNRTDTCTRANGAIGIPSDAISAYVVVGTWNIVSNAAVLTSNVDGVAILDSVAASESIQATLPTIASDIGLCIRSNAAGTSALLISINKSSGYAKLMKRTGGNATFANEFGAGITGITWVNGDVLKVTDTGSAVTVYQNGTQRAQWTDNGSNGLATYNIGNAYAGFFSYGTGTGTFSNLTIAALATMMLDRANILTSGAGTVSVAVTGSGTAWTAGTPGTPTFALTSPPTGWSIASQVVNSATSATLVLNRGTGTGTITVSDTAITATMTATVTATAVATGNWSAGATWDTLEAPGLGAKAIVPTGFAVTVNSTTEIGTSPNDTTTNVLTVTGTGTVTVNDGILFTVRGNVSVDNSTFQVGTGSTGGAILEFSSASSTPFTIAGPTATVALAPPGLAAWGSLVAYYYKVTALTASGESTGGTEGSATPNITARDILVTWPAVFGATGYKVYRSTSSNGQSSSPALVATVGASVLSFLDHGASASSGSAPGSNTTAAYYGYQCYIGGNSKTSAKFKVAGISSSPAIVRSNASGGGATVTVEDGVYDVSYATVSRMGDPGADAFYIIKTSATSGNHTFSHVIFDAYCGRIHVGSTLPVGMGFTLDYVTHKSLATCLTTSGATNPPSAARRLKGCVFVGSANFAPEGMTIGGSTPGDETLFLREFPNATSFSAKSASFSYTLIRHTGVSSGWRMGDWDEVAIIGDASTYDGNGRYTSKYSSANQHWSTPQGGPTGTFAVTNSLCESFGMDSDAHLNDSADGDFDYGPDTGYVSSYYKFLMIPQDRDSDATNPTSPACTATNMRGTGSTYDHCTCYNGQQGFIALCESTDGTAGQITSLKSNIVWNVAANTSGSFNCIAYIDNPSYAGNLATFPTANVLASGSGDYNCFFNGNTAKNFAGAAGYSYLRSGGTVPGAHDFVGTDPQFYDPTRRFWKWVKSLIGSNVIPAPASGGGSLTVASDLYMGGQTAGNGSPPTTGWRDYCAWGLYKLSLMNEPTHADYDSRYTLAEYKHYVRVGFVPLNSALKNAGHDGVTVGAFDTTFLGGVFPFFLDQSHSGGFWDGGY